MRVLVVGGAGYIGGAVTDLLLSSEHEFQVYDSLLYEDSYRKPVAFFRGDIRDHERLLPHLRWADVVIWLAALVGDGACALDPATSVEVNQASVQWLAENFAGRIIFLSTCSVYGAHDQVLNESSKTSPLSVYAKTKLAAERILSVHPNAISFRLGTLYGLSDSYSRVRFDLVVNTLTLRAQQTGAISVFGGEQYRPLLHVRDAARTIVRAIDQDATGVYNLHSENRSIIDLAGHVAAEFPGLKVERTPQKFEDNRNYRVTSEQAKRDLRFNPIIPIIVGIREIKRLLDEDRLINPASPRYRNQEHLALAVAGKESR